MSVARVLVGMTIAALAACDELPEADPIADSGLEPPLPRPPSVDNAVMVSTGFGSGSGHPAYISAASAWPSQGDRPPEQYSHLRELLDVFGVP